MQRRMQADLLVCFMLIQDNKGADINIREECGEMHEMGDGQDGAVQVVVGLQHLHVRMLVLYCIQRAQEQTSWSLQVCALLADTVARNRRKRQKEDRAQAQGCNHWQE